MKLIKSLNDKFKGLSKVMKIIVVAVVIPVALFGGIVVYVTSTVLIDTVLGTDISKTVNNEEYQKEQKRLKEEKEQKEKLEAENKIKEEKEQKEKLEAENKVKEEKEQEEKLKVENKVKEEKEQEEKLKVENKDKEDDVKKTPVIKEKEQSKKEDNNKTSLINEIILSKGHPIYYGNIENIMSYAKKIGKKFISVDIVGGDKYSKYTDDTALCINGYEYRGLITDIQIYLNNINESMDENEAINLSNKYLPKDIIKKYYKQPTGKMYTPEDKSKNTYKVIQYDLNEVGDKEREDDNFKYRGNIYVTLEEENNKIIMIRIHDEFPNWMRKAKFNGYKVEEWSINK